MKNYYTLFLLLLVSSVWAQEIKEVPPATPADERIESYAKRQALLENSMVANVPFQNIGPTVFSGRVADIAVSPEDPSHFYVGYASGGLWKTENNGITFTPMFDDEIVMSIGDIAVDWENDVIWVGTGEVNSSRSSYSGVGLFKSADEGKTWEHIGLGDSHHIGRIIIHPDDPNTVWVAALGHLYSPNLERGIFKTTDGGANWEKTLFVNENAGAVDLMMDSENPDVLYAATWERTRRAWNFVESGEGSGIYKSTDGGENWTLLTTEDSGYPTGENIGRIGLDMVKENGATILYSILDNYNRRPKEDKDEEEELLTKEDLREMTKEAFLALEIEAIDGYLSNNNFPRKYSTKKVRMMVKNDEIEPVALVEYVEDANSLLFETPVIGAEVYRSDDEGKTWTKTHDDYLDAVYNSYGYYFGQIRVAPYDSEKLFILGVPVLRSDDGGENWTYVGEENVHSDHHALWINPERPGHLILGNDGGINISYDDGESWNKANMPAVGQFYDITYDHAEPYNVYGGLQDNGVWYGPNTYQASVDWQGSGQYPYESIMGGDGMQVQVDSRDNATVYTGFQFGNYYRLNTKTGDRSYITPNHELGERPLRWNWQTPIHLSVHNRDILYMGSNKVHRSFKQGEEFEAISDDLTQGGIKGDVPFGTLTTIHESPMKFGLIYVGSDDGLVHVTKDGGNTWTRITDGLPENLWVSRVQASRFDLGTVYLALNGYRWDDFTPYVYKSTDFGESWERIGTELPLEPVNDIKEDPVNPNLLYVGTDHGLYISLDGGASFMQMNEGLPAVAVHDVEIHPEAHDLLVGTHGRSIYKASVEEMQQLHDTILQKAIYAFAVDEVRHSGYWGRQRASWSEPYEPEITIPYFVKTEGATTFSIKTTGDDPITLAKWTAEVGKGLNYEKYDLQVSDDAVGAYEKQLNASKKEGKPMKLEKADNEAYYLRPGTYTVEIAQNSNTVTTKLEVTER